MLTKMKTIALSAMIALGAFAAAPATAHAGDVRVGIQIGHYGPGWGHGPRYGHGPRWGNGPRHCTPARAVNKASRMGMRRAWVDRVGPNRIVVKGMKNGHRAQLVFGKAPNCPVRNWR